MDRRVFDDESVNSRTVCGCILIRWVQCIYGKATKHVDSRWKHGGLNVVIV